MLFRKKIPSSCSYCSNATRISEDQVLCSKKGIATAYGKCRKFDYDPCKRIPPKPKAIDFDKFSEEDFTL